MIQRSITICPNDVGYDYKALVCCCRYVVENVPKDPEKPLSMLKQTCLSLKLMSHVFLIQYDMLKILDYLKLPSIVVDLICNTVSLYSWQHTLSYINHDGYNLFFTQYFPSIKELTVKSDVNNIEFFG